MSVPVRALAELGFGEGTAGADYHITDPQKRQEMMWALGDNLKEVPNIFVFDCMEGREFTRFEDGTEDPALLEERVAGQLPSGLFVPMALASIYADAAFLRDTKTIEQAVEKTGEVLSQMGYQDSAHEDCGGDNKLEKSVNEPLPVDEQHASLQALGATDEMTLSRLKLLDHNRQRRVDAGFFKGWSSEFHAEYVKKKFPQNYGYLSGKDGVVPPHRESGLAIPGAGFVFMKNRFVNQTGLRLFGVTLAEAYKVADKLAGSQDERLLIRQAVPVNLFNVANHVAAKGLEVFVQAA